MALLTNLLGDGVTKGVKRALSLGYYITNVIEDVDGSYEYAEPQSLMNSVFNTIFFFMNLNSLFHIIFYKKNSK